MRRSMPKCRQLYTHVVVASALRTHIIRSLSTRHLISVPLSVPDRFREKEQLVL